MQLMLVSCEAFARCGHRQGHQDLAHLHQPWRLDRCNSLMHDLKVLLAQQVRGRAPLEQHGEQDREAARAGRRGAGEH